MNKTKVLIGGALAALALGVTAQQALAHHAFAAEFDASAPVLLRGKVTRVEWINPHAWVHLDAVIPGKPNQQWMVEGGTPNTLLRAGITRASLVVGTDIIVRGYQSKDRLCTPECRANGRDVTLANGQKIFMGSSGTGAPKDGADANEMPK
ncbi:hypothetical protein BH09PSE2_BH09PSE2_10710 [soil metagenome]